MSETNANSPVVSVCMTAYNGEKYIEQQLESILPQIGEHDEVIVSDDGSVDRTCAIVEGIGDPRVRLYRASFGSLIKNYEFALSQVCGRYVFLSDQDDVWLPGKVAVMTEALRTHTLAVCDAAVVDDGLGVIHSSFFRLNGSGTGLLKNYLRNGFLGCCLAFRATLLKYALPFPRRVPMHDWWLGLAAERVGTTCFVPEVLTMYRRHGENASSASEKSSVSCAQKIRWRLDLLAPLFGVKTGRIHENFDHNGRVQ